MLRAINYQIIMKTANINTTQILGFLHGNEKETKHKIAEHNKDDSENLCKRKSKAAYCSSVV